MKLIPQEKLNKALDKALLKHRPLKSERLINIIPEFLISERTQPVYSNDNNTCTYFSAKLIVSSIGFNEYLELDAKTNN